MMMSVMHPQVEKRWVPGADEPSAKGPLPLVIGVTGHRDLRGDDAGRLRELVAAVFRELKRLYPATPLVLLSPLAEGADRLVAEVALAEKVRLIAPLPLSLADYETDFETLESLTRFRELLQAAERRFVVGPAEEERLGGRAEAYQRVGAYIARNCQILIALWDGIDSGKVGGTSEIVRFRLAGVPVELDSKRSSLDLPETGPVVQIVTPRVGHPAPPGALSKVTLLPEVSADETQARLTFERMHKLMDQYNQDALGYGPEIAARLERDSRRYLLGAAEREGLPNGLLATLDRYATADLLAQIYQRRTYRLLNLILGLAFVMALLFQAHVHWRSVHPVKNRFDQPILGHPWWARKVVPYGGDWLASRGTPLPGAVRSVSWWLAYEQDIWLAPYDLVYLAMLGLTIWVYRLSRRRGQQTRYQDYRALAEGLRVQFYWRLGGLADSAADHYLRKQKGELDWIRAALRVGDLLEGVALPPPAVGHQEGPDPWLWMVDRHWVDGQKLYFVGVARPGRGASAARGWASRVWSLWTGPDFSALFVGKAQARRDDWKGRRNRWLANLLLLGGFPAFAVSRAFAPSANPVVTLLVILSAALFLFGVHGKFRAFSEHAKQYGRMGIVFTNAGRHLAELLVRGEDGRARLLLKELGGEALAESGDWILLHRERPLELPRA